MNHDEQNGLRGAAVIEEPFDQISEAAPPTPIGKSPYIPEKNLAKPSLKDNPRLLVIGGGILMVILLLAFSGLSRKQVPAHSSPSAKGKQEAQSGVVAPASMTPILDTGREPFQEGDQSFTDSDQIAHTARRQTSRNVPASLGSVPPFDNSQSWQPPPYRPRSQETAVDENGEAAADASSTKNAQDAMDKPSLVFVRKDSPAISAKPQGKNLSLSLGLALPPGTRLRARLESAVNTAVVTPVVAVIEYEYEQGGEIFIPAGAKAFGHLEAADRSGYIGIRFDSLMMPDGSAMSFEAAATDMQLRPLRGKVEGKHTGKNILVRSFAGVGEIAATLVGRGSLDQPLNEGDVLRERVSNNIGQASDQSVANLAITEHIVVSVPADTEIYIVLQKPAKEVIQNIRAQGTQTSSQNSIEQLRQLMQLQRELNQTDAVKGWE